MCVGMALSNLIVERERALEPTPRVGEERLNITFSKTGLLPVPVDEEEQAYCLPHNE